MTLDEQELMRAERRLSDRLAARGLVARRFSWESDDGPEAFADASRGQRSLVVHARGYPAQGENRCAAWVEGVFSWAGLGFESGHACELYQRYCNLDRLADLKVGMIVAVPSHPFSLEGERYGHVGIYVGDGKVMDCVGTGVRTVPLSLWLMGYASGAEARWGWMRGLALA